MKQVIFTFFLVLTCANSLAQLNSHEAPISFRFGMSQKAVETIIMPELDMEKIKKDDIEDELYDIPPRFGYLHKVNYNLYNSGTWCELPNGDKLWQLRVVCPNALSINFLYDKFWIPEGGKLFIYSTDRNHIIGAFTSRNNKGDSINVKEFATGLVYGSNVIIEYYQPKEISSQAIISVEYIVHGYRYISINRERSENTNSCHVNINCSEGQNWQTDKKAVALIIVGGNRHCTGTLINETGLSQNPLFLTANHCISYYGDANQRNNLSNFTFYWDYEAPGCDNEYVPLTKTTSGATILANNPSSDFALLRLTEDPKDLPGYTPYYMGWDNSGQSGDKGVCIHHPSGSPKKIATVAYQPSQAAWPYTQSHANYWSVILGETQNGFDLLTHCSSGAALLNATHKVIGQLRGGYGSCNDPEDNRNFFGKLDVSWTGDGNDSIQRRLDCWLDSLNTGIQSLEGLLAISSDTTITTNQQLYCNIRIANTARLTIKGKIKLMGKSSIIVEDGCKLILDGGGLTNADIVLKAGASLEIMNDGIIETRNGFNAPLGATVKIVHGKVL